TLLQAAAAHLQSNRQSNRQSGISPHAPYSTTPALIDRCLELAGRYQRTVAMHVAESPAERELLTGGTGPFAQSLRQLGVWREGLFPWGEAPFETLIDVLAKAPRALIVHGNDLHKNEIDRIRRHPNLSVVYCPRTHHFFKYEPHPVDRMLAAGLRVALGTDSRASNPDLNLWREVQFLLRHRGDLDPESVIKMATLAGSEAMGQTKLGRLEVGCRAVFGCVPTKCSSLEGVFADFLTQDYVPLALRSGA
ncbi:MAG: amidohydrolase family protein, partial [Pirellulales bacterium]|nr:amidohydrolase family protein [Pirellulales bacterium]